MHTANVFRRLPQAFLIPQLGVAKQKSTAYLKRFGKGYGGAGEKGKTFPQKGFPSPPQYLFPPSSLQILVDGVAGDVEGLGGAGQVVFVLVVDAADVGPDRGVEVVWNVLVWFGGEIFHHLFMFG